MQVLFIESRERACNLGLVDFRFIYIGSHLVIDFPKSFYFVSLYSLCYLRSRDFTNHALWYFHLVGSACGVFDKNKLEAASYFGLIKFPYVLYRYSKFAVVSRWRHRTFRRGSIRRKLLLARHHEAEALNLDRFLLVICSTELDLRIVSRPFSKTQIAKFDTGPIADNIQDIAYDIPAERECRQHSTING